VTAAETMGLALLEMVDHGQRPPCGYSSDSWMSEDPGERATAARRCAGCPLFKVCAGLASEIKPSFGVWAGRDWTKQQRAARRG
jgi:Transcription factor WhiB